MVGFLRKKSTADATPTKAKSRPVPSTNAATPQAPPLFARFASTHSTTSSPTKQAPSAARLVSGPMPLNTRKAEPRHGPSRSEEHRRLEHHTSARGGEERRNDVQINVLQRERMQNSPPAPDPRSQYPGMDRDPQGVPSPPPHRPTPNHAPVEKPLPQPSVYVEHSIAFSTPHSSVPQDQPTRRTSHAPGTYQQHPRESMRMSAHIPRDEKPLPLPVQRPDQSPPQHARNDLAVTSAQATAQRQSLAFSDASRFPPPDALSAHSAQQIPPMSSTSPPTRRRELPNIPSPQNTPPVSPDRPPQPPAHRRLSKHPPSVKHGIPKVKSDASHAIAESHTEQDLRRVGSRSTVNGQSPSRTPPAMADPRLQHHHQPDVLSSAQRPLSQVQPLWDPRVPSPVNRNTQSPVSTIPPDSHREMFSPVSQRAALPQVPMDMHPHHTSAHAERHGIPAVEQAPPSTSLRKGPLIFAAMGTVQPGKPFEVVSNVITQRELKAQEPAHLAAYPSPPSEYAPLHSVHNNGRQDGGGATPRSRNAPLPAPHSRPSVESFRPTASPSPVNSTTQNSGAPVPRSHTTALPHSHSHSQLSVDALHSTPTPPPISSRNHAALRDPQASPRKHHDLLAEPPQPRPRKTSSKSSKSTKTIPRRSDESPRVNDLANAHTGHFPAGDVLPKPPSSPRVLTKARPTTPVSPGKSAQRPAPPAEPTDADRFGLPLDDDPFARTEGIQLIRPGSAGKSTPKLAAGALPASVEAPSTPDAPSKHLPSPVSPADYKRARSQRRGDKLGAAPPPLVADVIYRKSIIREPEFFPLSVFLAKPPLLLELLSYMSYFDWTVLSGVSKNIRNMLSVERELREEVLERYLSTVGYQRWDFPTGEPLSLSLIDLSHYMRGVSMPTHQYSRIAESYLQTRSLHKMDPQAQAQSELNRSMKACTRAYTRVVLRLRSQAEAMEVHHPTPSPEPSRHPPSAMNNRGNTSRSSSRAPSPSPSLFSSGHSTVHGHSSTRGHGSQTHLPLGTAAQGFRSPLFRMRRAPLLRVHVPSPDGDWLSDASVVECEAELRRAGVLKMLRPGDVVWDVAAGDEGNIGRLVWDGSYLIDLDYTYSTTGDVPKYIHALAFAPSYFHRVIRTGGPGKNSDSGGNPVVRIDISPWSDEIASNLQLLQDRVRTET
ncbi:hypothetical protein PLICRDRAFT_303923 [Plicaturopsis crispa FD-325 SS-3]|nr:hypothetical protein PLICRDRAFT_303923 [Plicaturopsis crispa FD-325 SS-3]